MARDFSSVSDDPAAFRQQVRLAAVQVAGLRAEELAQALAYEVEPLSGIPAADADVSFRPVADPDPTVRVYDVAVRRRRGGARASRGLDRWLRPAVVLACVALAGLAMDGVWLARRAAAVEGELAVRRPLQTQLNGLKGAAEAARREADGIRSARERMVRAQDEVAALRTAAADLLDALAAACGDRAVVKALVADGDGRHVSVSAVAVSAEASAAVMQRLTEAASEKGWRLRPGAMSASRTGATASFDFEMVYER